MNDDGGAPWTCCRCLGGPAECDCNESIEDTYLNVMSGGFEADWDYE